MRSYFFHFDFIGRDFERSRRDYFSVFILINGFFIIFPQIDLSVSRYFFRYGDFFLSHDAFWLALRDMHRSSLCYLLASFIPLIFLYTLWRSPLRVIAPHKLLYIGLTFVLGPGVLVQGLKVLIGRARPRQLIEFGGTRDFTPIWQWTAMGTKNCSFPSGEAAAAAAMLSLLILLPSRLRVPAAIILVPLLMLVSLNRVFMGAHFLSDVVIAWTLVLGVMLWLWPRIVTNGDAIDCWVRDKGAVARAMLYRKAN